MQSSKKSLLSYKESQISENNNNKIPTIQTPQDTLNELPPVVIVNTPKNDKEMPDDKMSE